MENKNSAIEKTEMIADLSKPTDKTTSKTAAAKAGAKEKSVKKDSVQKKGKNSKKSGKKDIKAHEKKKKSNVTAEQRRVERDRKREEKKIALAKIRAERKTEWEKARAAAAQARERRIQALKEKSVERKAEREKRRDMLKSETKNQRAKRLSEEKKQKVMLKQQKRELKARLVSEKRENKMLMKEQKRNQRHERKKYHTTGIGGWLAAVISLGVSVIILASFVTIIFFMNGDNEQTLSNAYQKSYYDLTGYVDSIEVNLSKLLVSETSEQQQKLLGQIAIQSNLAENELQQLPIADENKYYTSKYVNQLGDISVSLQNKLISGGVMTGEDKELLATLYERNSALQSSLINASSKMGDNYDFNELTKANENDVLLAEFEQLENISMEYPEMIYDGPFSDGLDNVSVKGLSGEEISKEIAITNFKEYFSDYEMSEQTVTGEANGNGFAVYNIEGKMASGDMIFAQITKQGGKLAMFSSYESCSEERFTEEECLEIASTFIKKTGVDNMTVVWQCSSNNVAQFNFAYEQDGVIVYSDLIKVNVCREKGRVTAMEASGYYLNHTERTIAKAAMTEKQAKAVLSTALNIQSSRLTLIPVGNDNEKLAYEFYGTYGGSEYYVFVDASTGMELEIFKVIDTSNGRLLM